MNRIANRRIQPCAAWISLLLLPALAWGQGAGGTINGTVTDSTGAVIPGASIEVTNVENGGVTNTETGVNGVFYLPNMPVGQYNIAAESDGFKRAEVANIRLNVASEIQQSFILEIGAVTEVVEVSAAQVQVQTTSGSVGSAVQIEQMIELPLAGRNIYNLVNLVPGAYKRGNTVSIGGGRSQSAGSYIDGVENSRGGLGVQNIEMVPPIDSMQEFKVEVNAMGAEYGRSSAGVVQAVTRSGTNEFHGSLYWFTRNDIFDAYSWRKTLDADGNPRKTKLRRNNGGFSIGGPIVKNRTFFFFNPDMLFNPRTLQRQRNVGDPRWRTGDFSTANRSFRGAPVPQYIWDPMTATAGSEIQPRLAQRFPNNRIPASRFDPIGVKILSYVPDPTPGRVPTNPNNLAGNWVQNVGANTTRWYHTGKVEHVFSQKWRSAIRTIINPQTVDNEYTEGYGPADPNGRLNKLDRYNWSWINTYTFSPQFFVSVTSGINRVFVNNLGGDCCETNYADLLGIPGLEKGGEAFPRVAFNSRVPMTPVGAGYAHRIAAFTTWNWEAQFTKIVGNHTFKFGGKYNSYHGNETARQTPSGNWVFNGWFTRNHRATGNGSPNTGIGMADLLLGRARTVTSRISNSLGKRIKYWGGNFQDDWRVTPRLTLNMGFRYEVETPIYEVAGRMNGFCPYCAHPLAGQNGIPENAIGRVLFPNRDGTGKYLWNWDTNNIAPRFGFAYRLREDASAVLRGGFGIFYGNPYDRNAIQPGRAGFDLIFRRLNNLVYFREGVPAGALDDIPDEELNGGFGSIGTRFPTSTIQFWDQAREMPYSQNFNLTLQTRWKGVLWEFAVLGNLARHQAFANININQIHPDNLPAANAPGVNAATRERLYLPWVAWEGRGDQIQLFSPNWGLSNYWAGTFKSEKRFQNGLGWTVAYTHTQWIDNIRFIGAGSWGTNQIVQTIYDLRAERSSSGGRIPHRLVFAPIVDVPFGRGRRWGKNWGTVLNAIAGGWQVSGIGTVQSGGSIGAVVESGAQRKGDLTPGHVLRPNVTGESFKSPNQGDPAGIPGSDSPIYGIKWLNHDAFEIPDPFTLGNASRNLPGIRSPWWFQGDLLLAKNFYWGENWRAQFRAEMFSVTNTPIFGPPNVAFGSGGFGRINGPRGGRRVMEFGIRITF